MTDTLQIPDFTQARPSPPRLTARIVGQSHVVPETMNQQDLWVRHYSKIFGDNQLAAKIWSSAGITTRHGVANPAVEDVSGWSTGRRMDRYQREAIPLGYRAVAEALDRAGLSPDQVGLFAVVSCTGYATPGLDIRISEALGMSPDVQRLIIGHMGCYAAIPGLGAVSDFVTARRKPAVLLCIELTSLHAQPVSPGLLAGEATEEDMEQLVAHAIFADAASAIVLAPQPDLAETLGEAVPEWADDAAVVPEVASSFEILDVAARTDWTTQNLMRWNITDLGFRMTLSSKVPHVLAQHVRSVVDDLLDTHGYTREDVAAWAVHPGGRKILEVVQDRLELPSEALDASYSVLRDFGNCSSPTVLIVLERLLATSDIPSGAPVVAMAFGPGLTLYTALLRRA